MLDGIRVFCLIGKVYNAQEEIQMPEMRSLILDARSSWPAYISDAWNQKTEEGRQEGEEANREAEEEASRSTEGGSQPAGFGEHVA